jgi:hypothetical protein
MGFHWPLFHKPEPAFDSTAELRDRLVETETQLTLLRNLIERRPRRLREVRCDARSFKDAKTATTARLIQERKDANNLPLEEALSRIHERQHSEGMR